MIVQAGYSVLDKIQAKLKCPAITACEQIFDQCCLILRELRCLSCDFCAEVSL